jgi:hypothetical protein
MEENKPKNFRGILGIIFFIIVVYFLFTSDIKSMVNSSKFQNNITFIEDKVDYVWNQVIIKNVKYLWNEVMFKKYVNIDSSKLDEIIDIDKVKEKLGNVEFK